MGLTFKQDDHVYDRVQARECWIVEQVERNPLAYLVRDSENRRWIVSAALLEPFTDPMPESMDDNQHTGPIESRGLCVGIFPDRRESAVSMESIAAEQASSLDAALPQAVTETSDSDVLVMPTPEQVQEFLDKHKPKEAAKVTTKEAVRKKRAKSSKKRRKQAAKTVANTPRNGASHLEGGGSALEIKRSDLIYDKETDPIRAIYSHAQEQITYWTAIRNAIGKKEMMTK